MHKNKVHIWYNSENYPVNPWLNSTAFAMVNMCSVFLSCEPQHGLSSLFWQDFLSSIQLNKYLCYQWVYPTCPWIGSPHHVAVFFIICWKCHLRKRSLFDPKRFFATLRKPTSKWATPDIPVWFFHLNFAFSDSVPLEI